MPGFHKLKLDNKFHITSWNYKLPTDSKWHPFRNMFYKASSDSKWHPVWTYAWVTGNWGACSATCGGGIQYRTAKCVRSDTLIVHDSFCNVSTKPPLSQACNTHSCYWASAMQFYYGRHNTGDTRQGIGHAGPGHVYFDVWVTDTCGKGDVVLMLEKVSNTTGARTQIHYLNCQRRVCSNWREEYVGGYTVYVDEPAWLDFRGYISGRNNCCASIIVRNITKL